MGRNVIQSFSLSWKKGFSCSFNFYLGSRTFVYHTLIFFPAEKVKENFHCNQLFFFTALSEVLLSCRCRTGEWRAWVTCSWPPTCSWRNQTHIFVYCCRAMPLVRERMAAMRRRRWAQCPGFFHCSSVNSHMVLESPLSTGRFSHFFPWSFKTGLHKTLVCLSWLALLWAVVGPNELRRTLST